MYTRLTFLIVLSMQGGDRTVASGSSLTLDAGSSYDPDSKSAKLNYTWSCIQVGRWKAVGGSWMLLEPEVPTYVCLRRHRSMHAVDCLAIGEVYSCCHVRQPPHTAHQIPAHSHQPPESTHETGGRWGN